MAERSHPAAPRVVIVGGGVAGLTAAFTLRRLAAEAGYEVRVTVVEAADRFGGQVRTERDDGFVLEAGPDGFVAHKPAALELVRELGLDDKVIASEGRHAGVAVVAGGKPVPLPPGLAMLAPTRWLPLLDSPLLSWRGALRLYAERWVPPRRPGESGAAADESVAAFVRRRCGPEVLARIAEPIFASLQVGDVERMSLRASLPHLAMLERRHGSLARAARILAARRGDTAPGPVFHTLRDGLDRLIDALVARVPREDRLLGTRPAGLATTARDGDDPKRWLLALDDGTTLHADAVVLATPARAAADLLADLVPDAARGLAALRVASLAVVSLAYRDRPPPAAGFGFFVPRREGRAVLGVTWSSAKFAHRAPPGTLLARAFVGGALDSAVLERDDDALIGLVAGELRALCGLDATPVLARVHRWPATYPQYDLGHLDRLAAVEAALPPGLHLAGAVYHGVGLPDAVASGRRAAEAAFARLTTSGTHGRQRGTNER